jgi:hypothetical protein
MRGGAKYTKKRRVNKRKLTRRRNLRNKRKVIRGGDDCAKKPCLENGTGGDHQRSNEVNSNGKYYCTACGCEY